jgi:adenylate kinase family enzyme
MHQRYKIYFVIGASGSGKTTIVKRFEKAISGHFVSIYFDSIGIPAFEEMKKEYGSIEEWQRMKTIDWVKKIVEEKLTSSNVVFDAQVRPSFIQEACALYQVEYKVVLFDCSDAERKKRLILRGQEELADENMMNWAAFLRRRCQEQHYTIIDNSHMTIDQTLQLFNEWLQS